MGISAANSSLNPFCVTVIALSYRQLLYQLYTIYHSNPEEPQISKGEVITEVVEYDDIQDEFNILSKRLSVLNHKFGLF